MYIQTYSTVTWSRLGGSTRQTCASAFSRGFATWSREGAGTPSSSPPFSMCFSFVACSLAHIFSWRRARARIGSLPPSALSESPSIPPRARGRADRRSRPNWPVLRALHTFSARATTRARSSFPFGRRVRDASGKSGALTRAQRGPANPRAAAPHLTVIMIH